MVRYRRLIALTFGLLLRTAAAEQQDAAAIQHTVEAFVQAQTRESPGRVEVSRSEVDQRLRLPLCAELEAFLPPGARLWGNSTVGVRCLAPEKWTVFVPVQVRVWSDVVVSSRPLARGETLKADDFAMQQLDLTLLPAGVLTDSQRALGRIVSASVAGGTPLRADMLRAVPVVLPGQAVRVVFAGDGFQVSSEGRALGSAGIGELVQIRTASGKLIKGIVREAGVVVVR